MTVELIPSKTGDDLRTRSLEQIEKDFAYSEELYGEMLKRVNRMSPLYTIRCREHQQHLIWRHLPNMDQETAERATATLDWINGEGSGRPGGV